jgi:hypothetical protein
LPSSTVITPSLPTLSIASAIMRPTSVSPLAAIVATFWIDRLSVPTAFDIDFSASTTASQPARMPRFNSVTFAPEAAYL